MDISTAEARALESLCTLLESDDEKVILKAATEILRRITAAQRLAARKDSQPAAALQDPDADQPALPPAPAAVKRTDTPGPAPRTTPPPSGTSSHSAAPHRRNGTHHPLVSDTA